MTKQRAWQLKMNAEGRCTVCGKPRDPESKTYCVRHHLDQRRRNRRRQGSVAKKSDRIIGRVMVPNPRLLPELPTSPISPATPDA